MKKGAVPMTPLEDKPPVVSARSSRRVRGENPSILDGHSASAALKKLTPGGYGGRASQDGNEWEFHLSRFHQNNPPQNRCP